MQKIIFLDIDGTLCARDGSIPTSATKAVRLAHEKGHKIFLCTGRSKPELTDEILALHTDGAICAGGAYIETDGRVLFHKTMSEHDVMDVVSFFDENDIGYYLESNSGFIVSKNCIEKIKEITIQVGDPKQMQQNLEELNWFFDILIEKSCKEPNYSDINKIVFVNNTLRYEDIKAKFSDRFTMHPSTVSQMGKESGEIATKGCNKQSAIEIMLKELNLSKDNTIAFGDSYNDIDMFNAVAHSVAMDNAPQEIKLKADEVTPIAEEDGIYKSFLLNKLI